MFVALAHTRAYAGRQRLVFAETDCIAILSQVPQHIFPGVPWLIRATSHTQKKVTQEKKHARATAAKKNDVLGPVAVTL